MSEDICHTTCTRQLICLPQRGIRAKKVYNLNFPMKSRRRATSQIPEKKKKSHWIWNQPKDFQAYSKTKTKNGGAGQVMTAYGAARL